MATKALIRTGASLMNRLKVNPVLTPNLISTHRIANQGSQITPQLFPSLSKLQTSLHLPQNDVDPVSKVSSIGFLYPTGLPSLPFFLPDGYIHPRFKALFGSNPIKACPRREFVILLKECLQSVKFFTPLPEPKGKTVFSFYCEVRAITY
ncbi:hypothetical protein CCACVL1_18675 [Corchorus capsularis]|uniref:Uncharacterized protein n=1 Tax=Corchorus capsularis TaxID=210143 RepID=A0A1R3HK28_COCAP|nr:hypothetical protein CCACVL1_18675 [Corchorus capsularis]